MFNSSIELKAIKKIWFGFLILVISIKALKTSHMQDILKVSEVHWNKKI